MKNLLFTATATALLFASCSKDDNAMSPNITPGTGTGNASLRYEMQATNTTSGFNQRTTAGGNIVWTSGFVNPKEIKFEAKSDDEKIEYKSKNTDQIDLFAPSPLSFGTLMLPTGTYDKISLKIKLEGDNSAPALLLNGLYTDDLGAIPVKFIVNKDVEIKTEAKNVTVTPGTFAALTTLDLATYTSGFTEQLVRNGQLNNGVLVISSTSNTTLYNLIMGVMREKNHKWEYKNK